MAKILPMRPGGLQRSRQGNDTLTVQYSVQCDSRLDAGSIMRGSPPREGGIIILGGYLLTRTHLKMLPSRPTTKAYISIDS